MFPWVESMDLLSHLPLTTPLRHDNATHANTTAVIIYRIRIRICITFGKCFFIVSTAIRLVFSFNEERTGIKKRHESFESIFKDRRGRPIHLSRLVFLPFRRGHMVFSIFHSVVRCARKETGKGKYSKEEDGRNADINEDGGEYWSTLKDEEYNGGEELPRERLISLSEKFRRAGHLSTYAPVPFLPLLLSLLSRQILQRPFSSRESLFNRPDWKERRRKNKGKDGNRHFYVHRLGNDDSQAGCNRENSI